MVEPRWLGADDVIALRRRIAGLDDAPDALRSRFLLDAAVAHPRWRRRLASASVAECAAGYAWAIIRNHPFVDGNKRTGAAAIVAFLALNGLRLDAPDADVMERIVAVAEGAGTEAAFARWLERSVSRTSG